MSPLTKPLIFFASAFATLFTVVATVSPSYAGMTLPM